MKKRLMVGVMTLSLLAGEAALFAPAVAHAQERREERRAERAQAREERRSERAQPRLQQQRQERRQEARPERRPERRAEQPRVQQRQQRQERRVERVERRQARPEAQRPVRPAVQPQVRPQARPAPARVQVERRWNRQQDRRWYENRWQRRARNFDTRTYRRAYTSPRRYRGPVYVRPAGWYYRRWSPGLRFPLTFILVSYFINDWYDYGLLSPPWGYEWVRYGPDALLVDVRTGEILQVRYNVFY